jgi:Flp pilus assembly protein TadD
MGLRLRGMASLAIMTVLLGGCIGRRGIDVTGSVGPTGPVTEAQWRSEMQTWAQRHDANPGDRTAALRYGRALRGVGQHQQAVAVLQNAVLRHPKDMELMGALGRSLMDTGQLKQAEEVLSRAHLPERPGWRILSAQGAVADQMGDHARAQGFYEAALRINPGEPTVMSNLGLSYALSKQLPQAERVLTEAARHPQADARVRQNLVLVLGLQGRFKEAEQVAVTDLSPADAAKAMLQLRQIVSQPNSWDMLRQGGGAARQQRNAASRTGAANPPAPKVRTSAEPAPAT